MSNFTFFHPGFVGANADENAIIKEAENISKNEDFNLHLQQVLDAAERYPADFGKALLLVRRLRGMTQTDVSRLFSIFGFPYDNQYKVSALETGKKGEWSPALICLLLCWLKLPVQDLKKEITKNQDWLISNSKLF
ncbi:MAG: hypothetical protein EOP52_13660 [Sphingobacteriales bacterium]|nr:MAG: hypothetical protein EOP52_13660 [Sphingobacteriales bacterium]